jgi:hypothetical protein
MDCEHYWSIQGWIHSQRRDKLNQTLVEKLVRTHTHLVLIRESLEDSLRHLLLWDIDLVIDESVDESEVEPEVQLWIVVTHTYLGLLSVKTRVWSYNLYTTPFFIYPSHLTLVILIKLKSTQTVCTEKRESRREIKREKQKREKNNFGDK